MGSYYTWLSLFHMLSSFAIVVVLVKHGALFPLATSFLFLVSPYLAGRSLSPLSTPLIELFSRIMISFSMLVPINAFASRLIFPKIPRIL